MRVEKANVAFEGRWRIAAGIDGDERDASVAGRTGRMQRLGEMRKRGRADVGAMRVTEEQDDGMPALRRKRERLRVLVDEREVGR